MHEQAMDFVKEQARLRVVDRCRVLDIGGRDINGSPRHLFPHVRDYHVLDLVPGANVDFVEDATQHLLFFAEYDVVVCCEVLEHVENWPMILRSAWKALRVGGLLILTCAGPGRFVHSGRRASLELEPDEHYQNVDPERLRAVLIEQGFMSVQVHQVGLDVQAIAIK